MVESIKTFGQILPIVISRDKKLIAGGRRLAACMLLGIQARVCYKDTVDKLLMREMELEENIQRKALTPSEECLAVDELLKLKQAKHGTPTSGRQGGFTPEAIGELIGKSRAYVQEAVVLADIIRMFPELSEAKSKSDIKRAAKSFQRAADNITALASYEETIKKTKEFILVNRDAETYLAGLGEKSIDLFFTDPPYGIDIHELAMTTGGETGGDITTTNTAYDDSEGYAKALLEKLCYESFRVTKDSGHALIFCAPSHFSWLSATMGAAGWIVSPRPIVWIKRESGQNNQPEKWFSAAYEFILFARKPSSCLILQGRPDWVQCDIVLPSVRVHQAEKPVTLCKELISRCCLPGSYILDPCMGSGAIMEAGVTMKMLCLGCEKDVTSYAAAVKRMVDLKKE
jgi:site-specific DNA-methyltransferase (adenine-specific)